ncbi:hypothetical protein D3W54_14770 [Komagataeibacter medellinensis]|uniref:Bacteriophage P22, Gp10, DNA-stabilising n=1 Tax=Komagataeibacter medellinensis TaxID=1177712 RepID=A0ABQ6VR83_9PROT|nr:packaged DNA stabilization protein [Komagataeibacter medellinensis]KAB8122451.1 hypothetical protein D3W54_14770 [Komagataeibacter medellinensis]
MGRINLSGGTYQARSLAVAAQRCLNLYPEPIPQEQKEPILFAYYPTPGNAAFCTLTGVVRCLYTTSQGDLIACVGAGIYLIDDLGNSTQIGTISAGTTQVRIQDNGLTLFVVDGSATGGWYCALPAVGSATYGDMTQIADEAFYGSQTIAVLDTFLLFTKPGSNHWYVAPANFTNETDTPFDSLYIASKTSYPDLIVGIAVIGQTIWIFGEQTTELWYDSGATDFPFQRMPSILADQGCEAPYSIATTFGQVFWLGRDRQGHARVYMGADNMSVPISTFAVDQALNSYGGLSSAIGNTYQQDGHQYYVLTIPDMGKTWVFDATTKLWHERCGGSSSGAEARIRANCWAAAYGRIFCGDFENGVIYEVSTSFLDDAGASIKRQRAFPHLLTDGKRGIHRQFIVDMQNGSGITVDVDWSDDRGATFCNPVPLQIGTSGNVWPSIWRLGVARDRVYRLTWTGPAQTALMGAFIQIDPVRT